MKNNFVFEKPCTAEYAAIRRKKGLKGKPVVSLAVLFIIFFFCAASEIIMTRDPLYLDLMNCTKAPCRDFIFGTDTLGRDIFSMIWYGGRVSLIIGIVSTFISTAIALAYGTISAVGPKWLDIVLMSFADIVISIPSLLLILFLQALMGDSNVISISLVIGFVNWPSMSKVVRTEARQIRNNDYVQAAKSLGGSFFHILTNHFAPNFIPSIMFMVVMNVRNAIIAESTLSFLGMGLPIEVITWGSMLSLADKAILSGSWWMLVIPGLFLIVTIFCMTEVGNYIRKISNREFSRF